MNQSDSPGCTDYRIRPAVFGDLPQLAELEKQCFAIPWSFAALTLELADTEKTRMLVAVDPAGRILGYISSWFIIGEAEIHNIAVAPDCRRRGIGEALLSMLLAWGKAEQISAFTLEVRPSNTKALTLYRKSGFTEIGRRRGYYADTGEDAIIMFKNNQ